MAPCVFARSVRSEGIIFFFVTEIEIRRRLLPELKFVAEIQFAALIVVFGDQPASGQCIFFLRAARAVRSLQEEKRGHGTVEQLVVRASKTQSLLQVLS